jgi:hypothetical protein
MACCKAMLQCVYKGWIKAVVDDRLGIRYTIVL